MHPKFNEADVLSREVITSAIEVHRYFGPGLLETIYEWALFSELTAKGFRCEKQKTIRIQYKAWTREEALKCDLLINDCLLVEVKAIAGILPPHKAQTLSYMRLLNIPMGLILNFHAPLLRAGISRLVLNP